MSSAVAVKQRVDSIREYLKQHQLDAFLLPTADPHLGEYQAENVLRVEWLSGFHGENCIVVITQDKAGIFVDGRFTVQVKQQVPADVFEYLHIQNDCPMAWTMNQLPVAGRIGVDASLFNISWFNQAKEAFTNKEHELVSLPENPVDQFWAERPAAPASKIELFNGTDVNCAAKRQILAEQMKADNLSAMLLTQPEDTNWLVNIRGADIPYVRTTLSFGYLQNDGTFDLFIDTARLPEGFAEWAGEGVSTHDISMMSDILPQRMTPESRVYVAPAETNAWLYNLISDTGAEVVEGRNLCALHRVCKNETELEGMRGAHIQDGIAMCRFLAWVDGEVEAGNAHNEDTLACKLLAFREQMEGFLAPSFPSISALGANAAMCHYNHDPENCRSLGQDGMYLIDSGGHYNNGPDVCGTTDITRTLKVGEVTNHQRHMFTLVLKGHINMDKAKFLSGFRGEQLDMLARQPMWQEGYNFDHGTGHGVGHCLSVHEFPTRIRMGAGENGIVEEGMCMSNEPGYYLEDGFGIRLENIVAARKADLPGATPMLEFEALTFAPFDLRLIETEILTAEEKVWINTYHALVFAKVAPALNDADREWLKQATSEIA